MDATITESALEEKKEVPSNGMDTTTSDEIEQKGTESEKISHISEEGKPAPGGEHRPLESMGLPGLEEHKDGGDVEANQIQETKKNDLRPSESNEDKSEIETRSSNDSHDGSLPVAERNTWKCKKNFVALWFLSLCGGVCAGAYWYFFLFNNTDSGSLARTKTPTWIPTKSPSNSPSAVPTISGAPSISNAPTKGPSSQPSMHPTITHAPSNGPTNQPSARPTTSNAPSNRPTGQPSTRPTISHAPSNGPSSPPSANPSSSPSISPSTAPSSQPSSRPTISNAPTNRPTIQPSDRPTVTVSPSSSPTNRPSSRPTMAPSSNPTVSQSPTKSPSLTPTRFPTMLPSNLPTRYPTRSPTPRPTPLPTPRPTPPPTPLPTLSPEERYEAQLRNYLENDFEIRISSNNANQTLSLIVEEAEDGGFDEMLLTPKTVQRYALINMELALFGSDSPGQWGSFKQDECTWTGITCNGNREVTDIRLLGKDLQGSIPSEIGLLSTLAHLDLASNNLQGSIPEELYKCLSLQKIFLYQNRLSGTISDKIIDLWDLEEFNLSSNQISGRIPTTMRSTGRGIYRIRYFNVYDNQMTGPMIAEGARLRQLFYLDLGRNRFSGTIPPMDDYVRLKNLYLDHNQFTGQLPENIVNTGNGRIEVLAVNDNRFTGDLPGQHTFIIEMKQFTAQNNQFSGMNKRTCKLDVMVEGEIAEFKSDCNICACGKNSAFCRYCYN